MHLYQAAAPSTNAKNDAPARKLDTSQPASEPALPSPEALKQPPVSKPQASWNIEESKSPIDDSPQVTGMLHAEGSTDGLSLTPPTALVLRCQEKKTEAYLAKPFTFLGTNPIKVLVRINDGKPIETQWHPSSNGQGVFAPAAVQFIRALPDDGKLFIRVTAFDGTTVDGAFTLGKVSEIRDKIATACRWPNTTAHAGSQLLDKHEPQRQIGAAQTVNEVPMLGTAVRAQAAQLSQSEIDALRARISSCWSPPPGIDSHSKVYVVMRVLFKTDG